MRTETYRMRMMDETKKKLKMNSNNSLTHPSTQKSDWRATDASQCNSKEKRQVAQPTGTSSITNGHAIYRTTGSLLSSISVGLISLMGSVTAVHQFDPCSNPTAGKVFSLIIFLILFYFILFYFIYFYILFLL